MSDYFICPQCGAEVKRGAKACPACGSDEQTGWSELTYMDGISLPDEDEYNEFRDQEFSVKKKINNTWMIITGALLLVGFVLLVVKGMF